MKFPFFKAVILAGVMLTAWNCSDSPSPMAAGYIQEAVKELDTGNGTVYIAEDNTVKDADGNVVGAFDPSTGTIVDANGQTIVENVNKDELNDTTISYNDPNATADEAQNAGSNTGAGTGAYNNSGSSADNSTGSTTGNSTNTSGNNSSTAGAGNSSNNSGSNNGTSTTASSQQQCSSEECYDSASKKCYKIYSSTTTASGVQYGYQADCSIRCDYDPTGNNCSSVPAGVKGSASVSSGNTSGSTSSGTTTSGNTGSTNTVSSNTGSNTNTGSTTSNPTASGGSTSTGELVVSGSCPTIKYKSNDSKNGYATRYWDCAKPSCTWKDNAKQGTGISARSCALDGVTRVYDTEATSALDGGNATTCKSQAAFTMEGCSNMGFAFAAAPGNSSCGKCYELTFTGEGKYETTLNHRKLKGKKLIIMASNIGYDVKGEQFDIMIPGGGVGEMNACSKIGFNQGTTVSHGGILTDCEAEVGYSGSETEIYTKRKECLTRKCNATFSGDALRGCLFLANYMEAAGNPTHTYREIDCPQVLKDRY